MSRRPWGSWSLVWLLLLPGRAAGQPFHLAPSYGVGVFRDSTFVVADLDGDGEPDLVGPGPFDFIAVSLADGAGGYREATTFPAGLNVQSLDVADFNSDSIPDIVGADLGVPYPRPGDPSGPPGGILPTGVPGALRLLLGDGTGSFSAPISVDAGPHYRRVVARDLNGDGHADLLTALDYATALRVWLGDGAGHFVPGASVALGTTFNGEMRLADLNADGKWDLALPGNVVKLFLGDGNGGFGPPDVYQTGGQLSTDLVAADFDSDGKVDLAVNGGHSIYLFPGDGAGGLELPLLSPAPNVWHLDLADLDEDGKLDLAARGWSGTGALLGDGAGHFASGPLYVDAHASYGTVRAVDVDHGHLDLLAGNDGIAVLRGDGSGRFDGLEPLPVQAPNFPRLVAGDFDDDGKVDLGVVGFSSPGFILLGDGLGGFSVAGSVSGCSQVSEAAAGDFDGDSRLDLLAFNGQSFCVFLGDGSGSLSAPVVTASPSTWAFTVADFNEDGRSDLIYTTGADDAVYVLLASGNGSFAAPVPYLMNAQPLPVAAGDWNGDGHADIASVGVLSMNLSVRLGDGLGGFGPRTTTPLANLGSGLLVGDWNGDGVPDLALDTGGVLLGDGAGGFAPSPGPPFAPGQELASADFDVDGREDVATLSDPLTVSHGDGAGGFGSPWTFPTATPVESGASADFNGDGRPDIVLALQSGGLWPFLSQSPLATDVAVVVDDRQTEAVPGLPVSYTVVVTNLGPGPLPGVSLIPLLPPILLSPVFTPAAGAYDPATGAWSGLDLGAGDSALMTLTGTLDASATGSVVVSVSASVPPGYSDPNPANDVSSDVDTLTPQADLGVQLWDSGDPAPTSGPIAYGASLANAGPSNSPGATLSVELPVGAVFVSSLPGAPECGEAGGTLTCAIPALAPGQAETVTLQALVGPVPGTVTARATAAGAVADPQAANDVAWEATSVLDGPLRELVHGSRIESALVSSHGSIPPSDAFRVAIGPLSSWEFVVDGASGDLGSGSGPILELVDDEAQAHASLPAGAGASRSLRVENGSAVAIAEAYLRVASAGCDVDCGPQDVFRIRAWETTLSGARFNDTASQTTVVILQDVLGRGASGHVQLRDGAGSLLLSQPFVIPPHGTLVLNTGDLAAAQGQSGSLTVSHDAGYGALAGKAVAVEPATGFSFDTPLVARPR